MQNKWMHYVNGYIEVSLHGDYVERLFNMCRSHEIALWDIKRNDTSYCCRVAGKDFTKMHPLMQKTGTKVKVLNKCGLPFYIPFLKKRILFFIGVIGCLIMLNVTTDYIWAIEYVGNVQISDDELTDFLMKEGIHYGMAKKSLDCDSEEKQLRTAFPVVTWTSIYYEGTKLYIEVKENDRHTEEKKESQGMDILSGENGTIVSIITRNGVPKVKAGDTVEKGQILVSGQVPIYDESQSIVDYQIYEADADIMISTMCNYKKKISEMYPVIIYKKQKVLKGVYVDTPWFYLKSPILIQKEHTYETIREKTQICLLDNLYLPIYYGTILKKEYAIQYCNYSTEEMQSILLNQFEKFILCLQEKGVQIIEKDVKMVKNRKGMEINADLFVIKPTGEKTVLQQENRQEE